MRRLFPLCGGLAALLGHLAVAASPNNDEAIANAKVLFAVRQRLADTGSCEIGDMSATRMESHRSGSRNVVDYAVYWFGDYGCSRGSGSADSHLTHVQLNEPGVAEVFDPGLGIIPEISKVEYVMGMRNHELIITGWAMDGGDALYDPSIYEELSLVPDGAGWKVTNKRRLRENGQPAATR